MHCLTQELRCSTNRRSILPANSVNGIARISSKVQPFPPQPLVSASSHEAATFSRNETSLIDMMSGNSSATCFTLYFIVIVMRHFSVENNKSDTKARRDEGLTKKDNQISFSSCVLSLLRAFVSNSLLQR